MMDLFQKLDMYFQYPFVRHALIVGVLISLCASLLGVSLVLKRFSLIGEGLSHVAFGLSAIAGVLNITDDIFVVLPGTILCAILLLKGSGRRIKGKSIAGDAAIAMISVGAMSTGYLLMNFFPPSSNMAVDVCITLFGSPSILTLQLREVILCVVLSIAVLIIYFLFYHKIFALTFDENFAMATGVNIKSYNLLVAIVVAVIISLAINLVGSLLISALIVFPALSAMRVFKSFKAVVICAGLISVLCAVVGILIAILAGSPVGPTIVAANIFVFFLCWVVGGIRK